VKARKSQFNNGVWTAYGPNNPLAVKARKSQFNKKSQFNNGVWTAYGPNNPLAVKEKTPQQSERGLDRLRAEQPLGRNQGAIGIHGQIGRPAVNTAPARGAGRTGQCYGR